MSHRIFLYGTLRDPELYDIVAGGPLDARPGRLAGHRVVWAEGESFPLIIVETEAGADGLIVEVDDQAKERLDFYEVGFGYALSDVEIATDAGSLNAQVYFPVDGHWTPGAEWSLSAWQKEHGPLAREAAHEYMRLMAILAPEAAARAFPQVRMRASSRLRAKAHPTPAAVTPHMDVAHVAIADTRQPYTDYFAVQEHDLAFPRFRGGLSETVTRATFLGGDAVTVMPYDPALDSVLVIRQFRHGVFSRGDANPWTIEPAAGRIDPGETPEETARRELMEETGTEATALYRIADYYPSPSAYSEFIFSFVAIADLSGKDGTTSGLDSEHEDIMSHVLPFARLMEMVTSGAANTAPLVLSAFWLAANRATLRGAH